MTDSALEKALASIPDLVTKAVSSAMAAAEPVTVDDDDDGGTGSSSGAANGGNIPGHTHSSGGNAGSTRGSGSNVGSRHFDIGTGNGTGTDNGSAANQLTGLSAFHRLPTLSPEIQGRIRKGELDIGLVEVAKSMARFKGSTGSGNATDRDITGAIDDDGKVSWDTAARELPSDSILTKPMQEHAFTTLCRIIHACWPKLAMSEFETNVTVLRRDYASTRPDGWRIYAAEALAMASGILQSFDQAGVRRTPDLMTIDTELKNRVFDGAIAARCNLCGSSQHWTAQHGAKKAKTGRAERAPKDTKTKTAGDKSICGHFNGFYPSGSKIPGDKGCSKGRDCDRKHICQKSGGPHPASSCTQPKSA